MDGLTRENSTTIAFVESCFWRNAIDIAELKKWAEHIMVTRDDYPVYIVDLYECNQSTFHIDKIIGFTGSHGFRTREYNAVSGIALIRGREIWNITSKKALDALRKSPHIIHEFRETFPFIELPAEIPLNVAWLKIPPHKNG